MLSAVRNGMDVATLPNFVKEALASVKAARRVQNKLARQFPDQVKTKIPRSRREGNSDLQLLSKELDSGD